MARSRGAKDLSIERINFLIKKLESKKHRILEKKHKERMNLLHKLGVFEMSEGELNRRMDLILLSDDMFRKKNDDKH